MAESVVGEGYRIDDLARLAGTTVRNVRAYQDRGLLLPPVKVGRVGWYSEVHLARLRLVGEMLSRGYSLGNISELISGWARGQDLSDLLGLEAALIAPWGEDHSSTYSAGELQEMFPRLAPSHLERAVELELVAVEGDRYRVADPRLLEGANVLVEAGVPFEEVLRLGADVAALTDEIARVYVETVTTHLVGDAAGALAPDQVRRLAEVVRRLRPLAKVVVDAGLAAALERRIGAEVGQHLARAGGEPAAS